MAAGNSVFSPVTLKGVTPVSSHPPWSWITAPLPCQGLYPPSFPPFCCPTHTPPPPPPRELAVSSCLTLSHPHSASPWSRAISPALHSPHVEEVGSDSWPPPPPTQPLPGPRLTPAALHVPPLPGMFHPSQPHLGANPTRPSNPSSNVSSPTKLCPPNLDSLRGRLSVRREAVDETIGQSLSSCRPPLVWWPLSPHVAQRVSL